MLKKHHKIGDFIGKNYLYVCFLCILMTLILLVCVDTDNEYPSSIDLDYLNDSRHWMFGDFVLENEIFCSDTSEKFDVLILVHSAVGNFKNRQILRESLNHFSKQPKTLFLIGRTMDDISQEFIIRESKQFKDIVQGSFHDSYKNLTRKHVMGLTWVLKNCPNVDFVLKMDDDIFINLPLVMEYLNINFPKLKENENGYSLMSSRTSSKIFICHIISDGQPERDPKSKWFVRPDEFSSQKYPPFCSGWGYMTTVETIESILDQIHPTNFLWIDDVYITGILRAKAGDVFLHSINRFFGIFIKPLKLWSSKNEENLSWPLMFSHTGNNSNLLAAAYQQSQDCEKKNCSCCAKTLNNGRKSTKLFEKRGKPFKNVTFKAFIKKIQL